ncbi:hypothetical protein N9702_003044 [Escherichia coli]|nr:hypothetical protein [Escherichia coli]
MKRLITTALYFSCTDQTWPDGVTKFSYNHKIVQRYSLSLYISCIQQLEISGLFRLVDGFHLP